eukprot:3091040-Prymnesium_polylepis.1
MDKGLNNSAALSRTRVQAPTDTDTTNVRRRSRSRGVVTLCGLSLTLRVAVGSLDRRGREHADRGGRGGVVVGVR